MGRLAKSQTLQILALSFWKPFVLEQAPAVLPYSVQDFKANKNSVRCNPGCEYLYGYRIKPSNTGAF
jgi:hypothetical protein